MTNFLPITSCRIKFLAIALITLIAHLNVGAQTLTAITTNTYGDKLFYPVAFQSEDGYRYILGHYTTNPTEYLEKEIDMYVAKLDGAGHEVFKTLIGGSNFDAAINMKIENGEVYVLGSTRSNDFPVTDGSQLAGFSNYSITKLDTNGQISLSRYLGGTDSNTPFDLAVENKQVYIVGRTSSEDFPVTDGSTLPRNAYNDIYSDVTITKLNNDFSIDYSRFSGVNKGSYELYNTAQYIVVENGAVYVAVQSTYYWHGWAHYSVLLKLNPDGSKAYEYQYDSSWGNTDDLKVADGELYVGYRVNNGEMPSVLKLRADGSVAYHTFLDEYHNEYFIGYQKVSINVQNNEVYFASSTSYKSFPLTDSSYYYSSSTDQANDIVVAKLDKSGKVLFGTYIGGSSFDNAVAVKVIENKVYVIGSTASTNFPSTNGAECNYCKLDNKSQTISELDQSGKLLFSSYFGVPGSTFSLLDNRDNVVQLFSSASTNYTVSGILLTEINPCPDFPADNDFISPQIQTTCKNGITSQFVGKKIVVPAVTNNGVQEGDDLLEAKYQWQISLSASGPWGNIAGAVLRNYTPKADSVDKYYRRIAHKGVTCENATISISSVASVIVSNDIAPTVSAGGIFYTCPGAQLQIGGTITAQGGTPPYKYSWDNGAKAVSNPYIKPEKGSKIYTLTVTDSLGCVQTDKAIVFALAADAGPAKLNVCDKKPVRIGTSAYSYPMLAGTYRWKSDNVNPLFGIEPGGERKAQPMVDPERKTKYILDYTVYATNGGFCSTYDTIEIKPAKRPKGIGPDSLFFAGSDTVLCFAKSTIIGCRVDTSSSFRYVWSPGFYLNNDTIQKPVFDPGNIALPYPNPIMYYLTAKSENCFYVDSAEVAVIEANTGVGDCSTLIGKGDPTPYVQDIFHWEKIWGDDGKILSNAYSPQILVNKAEATYMLTVKYNKKECWQAHDVNSSDQCHCAIEIIGSSPCPKFDPKEGLKVQATLTAITIPGPYVFTWSPTEGLEGYDVGLGQTVRLTDTVERTYTVTAFNTENQDKCSEDITVNQPNFSKPRFKAKTFRAAKDSILAIGEKYPIPGYTYTWEGEGLSCIVCPNPKIKVAKTRKYRVKVSDAGGCETVDTVRVFLKLANAGPDQIVCSKEQVIRLGTPGDNDYIYRWTPSNVSWQEDSDESSPQPYLAVTASSTKFILTVTDPATGDIDSDTVTVKLKSFNYTDFDDELINACKGVQIPIGHLPQMGVVYKWSPEDGIKDPKASFTLIKKDKSVVDTLIATYPGGCVTKQKYIITVIDPAFSLRDTTFCPSNGPVELGVKAPSGMQWYNWTPSDSVSDPNIQNPTTLDPPPGGATTYKLEVIDQYGCVARSTITTTAISTLPFAGDNSAVCVNIGRQMGSPANVGTENWTITYGPDLSSSQFSCNPCAQPVFTPSKAGYYTISASQTDVGCTTTSSAYIRAEGFTLPTITDKEVCAGNSVNLYVSAQSGVEYSWSPSTYLDNTIGSSVYSYPKSSILYLLTATAISGACKGDSVSVPVAVTVNPLPVFHLTDKSICPSDGTVPLGEGAPSGMASYYWSPSSQVSSNTSQNPSTNTAPSIVTDYTLRVTDAKGCRGYDTTTLTPVFLPKAGINRSMCVNTSETLGDASNGGTYTWSISSGPNYSMSQLSCTNCNQPVFAPTNSGVYTLKLTSTLNGCTNSANVKITVYDVPLPSLTSPVICSGKSVTIGGYGSSEYTYSWSPAAGLSSTTLANPVATPSETTTYSLTVTGISGSCAGSISSGSLTVNVNPNPLFSIADIIYCPSDGSVNLGGDAPVGLSSYKWIPSTLLNNSSIRNPSTLSQLPVTPTTFTLTVTDSKGCKASSSMQVTPSIEAPFAGNVKFMCVGLSEYLGDDSNSGIENWSIVSGPDISDSQFSCTTCATPLFTPTVNGVYNIQVSRTEGICTSISDLTITTSEFKLNMPNSYTTCSGNPVQIGLQPIAKAQYLWTPSTFLSDASVANPIATVNASTLYTLDAIDQFGCPAHADVQVLLNPIPAPQITIPDITVPQSAGRVTLMAEIDPPGDYDYLWNPNDGTLNDIYLLRPSALISTSGNRTYTLTATNRETGCMRSASMKLTITAPVKSVQHIDFNAIQEVSYGNIYWVELEASALSGLELSFTSSNPDVAVISGNYIQIIGAGTSIITATQQGNERYLPAPAVMHEIHVLKAENSIIFNSLASLNTGDTVSDLTGYSTSGLPVSYSSSDTNIAIVSGNQLIIRGGGAVTITAMQAGDSNYKSAISVPRVLIVYDSRAEQSIVFNLQPTITYGDEPIGLVAETTSGLPVLFSSSDPDIASISGNILTIKGAGNVVIRAFQSGNSVYAQTYVDRQLEVKKADQWITFDSIAPKIYHDESFFLNASSSSGLPVIFSSSDTNILKIEGSQAFITGIGQALITAQQPGNTNYEAATPITRTVLVNIIPENVDLYGKPKAFLYPNPVSATLTIILYGFDLSELVNFEITNPKGELIAVNYVKGTDHILLDVTLFPTGIYMVRLLQNSKVASLKFVKQ